MTIDLIQGTDAWRLARVGKVTASRASEVVARIKKGEWGAQRRNYKADLVIERLTKKPKIGYVSKAMEQGTLREPDARNLYALMNDVEVIQVGFVDHPTIPMSGCSPDGYVDDDGMVEFKCPEPAAHLDFLLSRKIDSDYIKQIAWQLSCHPDRQWVDFTSYNPDFDPDFKFPELVFDSKRVFRRDVASLIEELEKEVPIFLREVDKDVALARALRRQERDQERERALTEAA